MSTTHVPAWKRLGLTLKPAKYPSTSTTDAIEEPAPKKRRVDKGKPPALAINGTKESVTNRNGTTGTSQRLKKQVSFTADTKTSDGDSAVSIVPSEEGKSILQPNSSAKKLKKTKKPTPPAATKPNSALDYLTQYYRSHPTWKFNKNREVWILKNALSTENMPPTYNPFLAQYIHGLKSQNTRDRLRLQCITAAAELDCSMVQMDPLIKRHGRDALDAFPANDISEDTDLYRALCDAPRALLVQWAIDPTGISVDRAANEQKLTQIPPNETTVRKKRKNRTAVVEYPISSDSSSSSSSSDDTSSSDGSESDSSSSES